jgi:hypothetical protein
MPEPLKSYIVFPFHRVGATVGTSQAIVFDAADKASSFASAVGQKVSGVAILERSIDPETGDQEDRLVAKAGAVPPQFPLSSDWILRLN